MGDGGGNADVAKGEVNAVEVTTGLAGYISWMAGSGSGVGVLGDAPAGREVQAFPSVDAEDASLGRAPLSLGTSPQLYSVHPIRLGNNG
jgi:hypothetical protein